MNFRGKKSEGGGGASPIKTSLLQTFSFDQMSERGVISDIKKLFQIYVDICILYLQFFRNFIKILRAEASLKRTVVGGEKSVSEKSPFEQQCWPEPSLSAALPPAQLTQQWSKVKTVSFFSSWCWINFHPIRSVFSWSWNCFKPAVFSWWGWV